jgi:hypothetical protein
MFATIGKPKASALTKSVAPVITLRFLRRLILFSADTDDVPHSLAMSFSLVRAFLMSMFSIFFV